MRLQSEIAACNGETLGISDDLDKFKHSIVDQLKNSSELTDHVNSLNQKTDAINAMLNFLKSTPNAHGQDFLALLNKTAERRIDVLSDSQTNTSKWLDEAFHRISHINQTGIDEAFHRISHINQTGIDEAFHRISHINQTGIDEAFHRISHINQTGIGCSFI